MYLTCIHSEGSGSLMPIHSTEHASHGTKSTTFQQLSCTKM